MYENEKRKKNHWAYTTCVIRITKIKKIAAHKVFGNFKIKQNAIAKISKNGTLFFFFSNVLHKESTISKHLIFLLLQQTNQNPISQELSDHKTIRLLNLTQLITRSVLGIKQISIKNSTTLSSLYNTDIHVKM